MKTIDYTLQDALLLAGASACISDYIGTLKACKEKAIAACEILELIEQTDVAAIGQENTLYSLQHNSRALQTLLSTAVDAAEYMKSEIYTINRALDRYYEIKEEHRQGILREAQKKERNKKYYRSKKARKAEHEQQEAKAE